MLVVRAIQSKRAFDLNLMSTSFFPLSCLLPSLPARLSPIRMADNSRGTSNGVCWILVPNRPSH
jgi:hypothetical protein